jgi:hypothetical protein
MSDGLTETCASLMISSEVMSGQRIAELLELEPSKIFVKGTPTGQANFSEHPFHIAIFQFPLDFEERLERHLAAVLGICEQRQEKLLSLAQHCKIHLHCTYLVREEGGWTLTQDLCRRMALLPMDYVFAIEPRTTANGTSLRPADERDR